MKLRNKVMVIVLGLVCSVVAFGGFAGAGQGPAKSTLSPLRPNLTPIHWPDISKLEPTVRAQLTALQDSLSLAVQDPAATDETLAEAYGSSGEIYHAYGLTQPARECYLNAAQLKPKDFRWLYLLGKLDQQDDRIEAAIQRLTQARALRPDYVAAPVNLGYLYLQLNRLDKATESFNDALRLNPANGATLYGLGQVALSERRYREAAEYFEKALQQVPAANRIHYSLAMAYRGLGNLTKAKEHLDMRGTVGVRVADPLVDRLPELLESERIRLVRGRTALEAKRFQDAAEEFRQVIAAHPGSITAHQLLGNALLQMKDFSGAIAEFETTLRLDPENPDTLFNLAVVLATANQHAQAIEKLQWFLQKKPNDLTARHFLARELLKLDQYDEALTEFTRIAQANPDDEAAVLAEVKLLQQLKRYNEALNRIEKSAEQYPKKIETSILLAYLLAATPPYQLRDGERALKLAQTAYQATGQPQHGALVSLALAELGRCREAADWQRRMIGVATQQNATELVRQLEAELKNYEGMQSCRP